GLVCCGAPVDVVRAPLVLASASAPARRAAVPPTLDLIVQPALSPRESLAADRRLLDEARAGQAALRVYTLAGDVLSLGRYPLAPKLPARCAVELWRPHPGGRALPWGEGFGGLWLLLPPRRALVASAPDVLPPP